MTDGNDEALDAADEGDEQGDDELKPHDGEPRASSETDSRRSESGDLEWGELRSHAKFWLITLATLAMDALGVVVAGGLLEQARQLLDSLRIRDPDAAPYLRAFDIFFSVTVGIVVAAWTTKDFYRVLRRIFGKQ